MYNEIDKKEYEKLINYAGVCLFYKDRKELDKRDIVHDAILLAFDRDESYSFNSFKGLIKTVILTAALPNSQYKDGKVRSGEGIFKGIDIKVCKCCQTELPISFFRITNVYGRQKCMSICKSCEIKKRVEYERKRIINIELIEKRKQYQKEYREKRKKIINSNQKLKEHFLAQERERSKNRYEDRKEYFSNYEKKKRLAAA